MLRVGPFQITTLYSVDVYGTPSHCGGDGGLLRHFILGINLGFGSYLKLYFRNTNRVVVRKRFHTIVSVRTIYVLLPSWLNRRLFLALTVHIPLDQIKQKQIK